MVRRNGAISTQHSGSMNPPRKLHIKSYGCQMNVYDAQRMVDTLAPEGFVETSSVDDADLVILNTCHIREKASEKVYSELGRLRDAAGHRDADMAAMARGGRLRRAGQQLRQMMIALRADHHIDHRCAADDLIATAGPR